MQPTDSSSLQDLSTRLIGTTFADRFTIKRCVGTGGTSTVFAAFDRVVSRDVAIKILHPWLLEARSRVRFLQEAKALSRLSHPNIVPTFVSGQWEDFYYIVMALAEGQSLAELLNERGKLSLEDTCAVAIQAASALAAAHAQGVIHRDVKPGNIVVTTDGGVMKVQLLDFGIAKFVDVTNAAQGLTGTDHILGTPSYMSPEQCAKKELTAQSDIYSLGCVIYKMLTGEQPYSGETAFATMYQHMEATIPQLPQDVPGWLSQLVYAMLEKDCSDRPASMANIVEALEQKESLLTRSPRSKSKRLHRSQIVVGAVLFMLIGALLVGTFLLKSNGSPSERVASAKERYLLHLSTDRKQEAFDDALEAANGSYDIATSTGNGRNIDQGPVLEWGKNAISIARQINDVDRLILAEWTLARMDRLDPAIRLDAICQTMNVCSLDATVQQSAHPDKAMSRREEALDYLRQFRERSGFFVNRNDLDAHQRHLVNLAAETAMTIGNWEKAKHYYQQSVQLERKATPGSLREAVALLQGAVACRKLGEVQFAQTQDAAGRALLQKIPLLTAEQLQLAGSTYVGLARHALLDGNIDQCERDARAAHELLRRLGPDRAERAEAISLLGQASFARKDYAQARKHHMRCIPIYKRSVAHEPDHYVLWGAAHSLIAQAWQAESNWTQAEKHLQTGLALATKANASHKHDPCVESLRLQLAYSRRWQQDYSGASKLALETVQRLTPDSNFGELGCAYELLAQSTDDSTKSVQYLKLANKACLRAHKKDCECAGIALRLSNRQAERGNLAGALSLAIVGEQIAHTMPEKQVGTTKALIDTVTSLKARIAAMNLTKRTTLSP